MKKHKQTPRILTTFPSAKSRTNNPPISSTFSLDAVGSLCSSSSSSSSTSSRSHFPSNKLKSQSNPSVAARNNLARPRSKPHSKENDFSRKLGNDKRTVLSRRPVSKPVQRSNLLPDLSNSSSGSEQFRLKSQILNRVGYDGVGSGTHIMLPSNCEDTCTPFGKGNKDMVSDSVSGRAKTPPIEVSVSPEIQFGSTGFGNSTRAKTPPVEASVSPEIQFGAAAVSTGSTPVCYGTSHLLSGVKDKRKCRSKGILIIGDEIDVSVEDDDTSSNHKFTDSRPSFVPCPANAAMIWLSSPKDDVVDKVSDAAFGSPILSGFESNRDHSDNKSINANGDKTRSSFNRLLGGSSGVEADMDLSSSPSPLLSEKYSLSSSSLSCGNVVQTPTSDLSSDHKAVETYCWTDTNSHQRKLDLGAEIPDYNKREEEERLSYVSDCTLASMSFTGLRISWREGLGGQSFDRDEDDLDCCRCLSDEEEYDCHQTSSSKGVVTENPKPFGSVENEKEAVFRTEPTNVSAESISLDRDRLIASGDSDWTLYYKNHL